MAADTAGETLLEVVQLVADLVKARDCRCKPEVLPVPKQLCILTGLQESVTLAAGNFAGIAITAAFRKMRACYMMQSHAHNACSYSCALQQEWYGGLDHALIS